jgi:hypothetical protein
MTGHWPFPVDSFRIRDNWTTPADPRAKMTSAHAVIASGVGHAPKTTDDDQAPKSVIHRAPIALLEARATELSTENAH